MCVTAICFTVAAPVETYRWTTPNTFKSDILKDKQLTSIINILLECFVLSESML